MTHILSNLLDEYQNIVEVLDDGLNYEDNILTIDRICDKILVKYHWMSKKSRPKTSWEDKNPFTLNLNSMVSARLALIIGTSQKTDRT